MSEEKCKVYQLFKTDAPVIPNVVWECGCGCQLFYVNFEGWTCSACGTYQIFKD